MEQIVLTRRRVLSGALVLALVLLLGARFIVQTGPSAGPGASPVAASAKLESAAAPAPAPRLVVHVVGAVRRPGVYRLADGTRVQDALSRAGGPTGKADLLGLNLAAPLADGQQVLVPARLPRAVAAAEGAPLAGGGSVPAGPVQLSVATLEQLDELPGIGPVTAQKIVAYRTEHGAFRSVEDLDDVPGIGPSRVDQLRDLVVP